MAEQNGMGQLECFGLCHLDWCVLCTDPSNPYTVVWWAAVANVTRDVEAHIGERIHQGGLLSWA
jgi:hypothetical protein